METHRKRKEKGGGASPKEKGRRRSRREREVIGREERCRTLTELANLNAGGGLRGKRANPIERRPPGTTEKSIPRPLRLKPEVNL